MVKRKAEGTPSYILRLTRLKSKVFSLERLLFWSLLLQRKSKVCGLRWGGMDELEVKSLALDKG